MQKKLLSFLLITAITYSCSKGLSPKDNENKATTPTDKVVNETKVESKKAGKNKQNEIARKVMYFETNSFVLNEESNNLLKTQIFPLIQAESRVLILVEGHCDERGSSLYNKRLGKKRAEEVKKFLVKSGIKASKISAISYGENKPVDLGHDENAWSKNRRVEIVLFN
jgi:peptidoglycan-associated lipoprotein